MDMRLGRVLLCIVVLIACNARLCAHDTIAVASHRYDRLSIVDKAFLGNNYRRLWSMPVTCNVFYADRKKSGFTIKGLGGGMQTQSLHLVDDEGNKWALRSVDKTVDRAMEAEGIKDKRIRRFSQKMLSASHPYGALTIPLMADALGIINTAPRLVYVADDAALGAYYGMFANSLCILEKREPVLHNDDSVTNTAEMIVHLGGKMYSVDEKMLLQARLLDMLVGDWDRHDVQWRWGYHTQKGRVIIYPIPRDHDQAYFNSNGLFINIVRTFNIHMFVGFRKSLKLNSLNYKAWSLDKRLLKDLSEEEWKTGIQSFQAKLTDKVLDESVHRFPPQVYEACGAHIYKLMRIRRDKMMHVGLAYYRFLQHHSKKIAKEERKERIKGERAEKLKQKLKEER